MLHIIMVILIIKCLSTSHILGFEPTYDHHNQGCPPTIIKPLGLPWACHHQGSIIPCARLWPWAPYHQLFLIFKVGLLKCFFNKQGHVHGFQNMSNTIQSHHHQIQGFHDPNKGCKVITNTKRASSYIPSSDRHTRTLWSWKDGFMDLFNHLNHTRRPPRVKIHHATSYGVARPSLGVPWHHQSMNDQKIGH